MLGRNFTPEEEKPNGPNAAIISHGLWQRAFGGQANIIGQSDVMKMVLGQGTKMAAVGVGLGAFALTRVMSTLLFEVSAADPVTFAAVVAG
jgi:hypothetical protein